MVRIATFAADIRYCKTASKLLDAQARTSEARDRYSIDLSESMGQFKAKDRNHGLF